MALGKPMHQVWLPPPGEKALLRHAGAPAAARSREAAGELGAAGERQDNQQDEPQEEPPVSVHGQG